MPLVPTAKVKTLILVPENLAFIDTRGKNVLESQEGDGIICEITSGLSEMRTR